MKQRPPTATALRVADLPQNAEKPFSLRPDASALKAIAADLDLLGLRKLSFEGALRARGAADWQLDGHLGATVIQPCVATLAPVTTRIDTPVTRVFLREHEEVDAPEAEMPEDDTTERLGKWIDPQEVMIEALVLALPLYPRSEGAGPADMVFAEPGVTPMRDEDARPFAGLAGLRDQLVDKNDEPDET